ncbi:PaaI family thioesterase [Kitasatospora sp. GAS204B]|uniref:PaaI family thioesterase n=1 Tax=unclassified Kitasatospora TaxID=2633591 RepID=UPI00247656AE|nr:PaaI family thioesterase [Kitasatospora sp. GAS204B]MDH6121586.1 acyl-coenzyme A thioesterase PaaI-like protein [Kitasatospora sp. GAS204B]
MPLTCAEADQILADNFAPWVRALRLQVVETGERSALLRLPWSPELAREGGGLSGQALMAAADTATVIALSAALGGFGPMTTIQQSTSFQRAVVGADVLVAARVTKLGRRLAFTEVVLTAEGEQEPAAQASTVYAFPG